jgi:hypothetical protein
MLLRLAILDMVDATLLQSEFVPKWCSKRENDTESVAIVWPGRPRCRVSPKTYVWGKEIRNNDAFNKATKPMSAIVSPDWMEPSHLIAALKKWTRRLRPPRLAWGAAMATIPVTSSAFHLCCPDDIPPLCEGHRGLPSFTLHLCQVGVDATTHGGGCLEDEISGLSVGDRRGTSRVSPHKMIREVVGEGEERRWRGINEVSWSPTLDMVTLDK